MIVLLCLFKCFFLIVLLFAYCGSFSILQFRQKVCTYFAEMYLEILTLREQYTGIEIMIAKRESLKNHNSGTTLSKNI